MPSQIRQAARDRLDKTDQKDYSGHTIEGWSLPGLTRPSVGFSPPVRLGRFRENPLSDLFRYADTACSNGQGTPSGFEATV